MRCRDDKEPLQTTHSVYAITAAGRSAGKFLRDVGCAGEGILNAAKHVRKQTRRFSSYVLKRALAIHRLQNPPFGKSSLRENRHKFR